MREKHHNPCVLAIMVKQNQLDTSHNCVYLANSFTHCTPFITAITIGIQGGKRFSAGSRPPEDAKLSLNKTIGKGGNQSFGTDEVKQDNEVMRKAK
jgi:hypothetical protein